MKQEIKNIIDLAHRWAELALLKFEASKEQRQIFKKGKLSANIFLGSNKRYFTVRMTYYAPCSPKEITVSVYGEPEISLPKSLLNEDALKRFYSIFSQFVRAEKRKFEVNISALKKERIESLRKEVERLEAEQ